MTKALTIDYTSMADLVTEVTMTVLTGPNCKPVLNNYFSHNNINRNNVNIQSKTSSNKINKNNSNQVNLDILRVHNLTNFTLCRRALIDTGASRSIIKKKNVLADILKNNEIERAINWHTNGRSFF